MTKSPKEQLLELQNNANKEVAEITEALQSKANIHGQSELASSDTITSLPAFGENDVYVVIVLIDGTIRAGVTRLKMMAQEKADLIDYKYIWINSEAYNMSQVISIKVLPLKNNNEHEVIAKQYIDKIKLNQYKIRLEEANADSNEKKVKFFEQKIKDLTENVAKK